MTFPRTKIQLPKPRSTFIERGVVQARLAEALTTRRLALLCAPAGYGKTMLLAHAVAALPHEHAVAWVAADAGDDLQRLLECMLAALEPFDPPWRTAPEALVAKLGGGAQSDETAVAAEVINTLDACELAHGVIVLDDVHRVEDPTFFRFLDRLIERMSARWTMAVTSRTEPPLALARLRASGELAEFRQLELQFARREARQLASAAGVDEAIVDRMFDRTHGWPAGLQIAIGAAAGSGLQTDAGHGSLAPATLERTLRAGERQMFEFLVTEVLDKLPEDLATFLLRISVLPEVDAARAAAVSGNANATRLLDDIERLGLFADVLDAPLRTLRLHDLFRDALQQRLLLESPDRLAEAKRRAAETEPDPVRRITLLLDAAEPERAAKLMFLHGPVMVPLGTTSTALHLIQQFPAEFRERSPELHYVRGLIGWGFWDFSTMLGEMERAEAGFASRADEENMLLARAYRAAALIARGRIDEAASPLESLRPLALPPVTRAVFLNALSWHALETGRLHTIAPLIDEMVGLLETANRLELWYQLAPPTRVPGLRGVAAPLRRHAENIARVAGDDPTPLRAMASLMHGWDALWRADLDEARAAWQRARADAQWTGSWAAVRGYLLAQGALLDALAGNSEAALATALERIRDHPPGYGGWGRHVVTWFAARIATICGDAATLRELVDDMRTLRPTLGSAATPERMRPSAPLDAQLAWLDARIDDAIDAWRDALGHEEQIDIHGQAAECRVRLARALVHRAAVAEAAEALGPVFERVEAEGAPGGALLATDALRELASFGWGRALPPQRQALLRDWCQRLDRYRRAQSSESRATTPRASDGRPPGGTEEPLTARESEVLARVAAGESNKVIARALDLSLHTVKRHVANILDKLDVQTRGQAAAWYRSRQP